MAAFAGSTDWVVPHNSAASRLYAEFSTGKMSFMRAGEVIRQWIDTGAVLPPQPPADSGVAMTMTAFPLRQHLSTFLPALDAPVCQANCSRVADGRRPALEHLRQRSRLARSCTNVVGGCFIAARSTSLGVLQRAHRISSHGNPPFTAWSIVGDGSIGSPSDHMRSFQLSQSSLSACWMSASPFARVSADWAARGYVEGVLIPAFQQSLEPFAIKAASAQAGRK
jgi:hypothetical protein